MYNAEEQESSTESSQQISNLRSSGSDCNEESEGEEMEDDLIAMIVAAQDGEQWDEKFVSTIRFTESEQSERSNSSASISLTECDSITDAHTSHSKIQREEKLGVTDTSSSISANNNNGSFVGKNKQPKMEHATQQ
jgi:hypothetical protein